MLPDLAELTRAGRVRRGAAGAAVLALLVLGAAACNDDGGSSSGTTVPDGVPIDELQPGDCYQAPESPDFTAVEQVPCDQPHDAETFATFEIDQGDDADFPGAAEVQSLAQEGCEGRFEEYVGQPFADSPYYVSFMAPTQASWENRNDRHVVCSLLEPSGEPLEGSLRGSAAQ